MNWPFVFLCLPVPLALGLYKATVHHGSLVNNVPGMYSLLIEET